MILTTVFYTIIRIVQNKQTRRFTLERQIIETTRTIAPAVILVFIAIPSLRLLYLIDEIHNPEITLKQLDTNDIEDMNTQTLYVYPKVPGMQCACSISSSVTCSALQ